ncbi:4-diphosphocytidyl-2-C-methyl-D-erythritol kinase [Enterococcus sp. PF1-24]|uniref:4-(cytidine 5'-diphospho)-2-C-methyl-D-erythritol kinase n=1 Tax=unclassified Enterococcus TaxID=2608891 RepID=UPI002476AE0D|nr:MULTISPECIES: 4-(cytidine 5'-diphospho)-2-C-methyl-D-erythritol kinase [unclassified Enterococcus]MDH6364252.1 4-diphosphocytidyl-2-C-methyl-D-erythritol kinase [Enterococcus sp. PFB1-1]MDH6401389.1 4-diphosphocytidyl-2-C-methyl-D-erythritol kinase [Enterococcus sp. PF1-24]
MEIIEKAPAKINLGLDVIGKRPDNYHELAMVMTSVDLADRIQLIEIPENKIIIETNKAFLPTDSRNNVYQAIDLVKQRYQIQRGVKVYIQKEIPVAAGLGGGSSDCAAALRGINRMWDLGLSLEELAAIGLEIGTDVPFCIYGGTALAEGVGEKITPLANIPTCWVVLVKPPFSVSTPTVFQNLQVADLHHPDIQGLISAVEANDYQQMLAKMGNSLEAVTIRRHPVIQKYKNRMLKYGADAVLMTGSGPTVFGLCNKLSRAQRVFNGLKGFCDEVYLVRVLKN